ncbi:MAG: signal recognition particle protein [Firmicutes bacterium]|nr:signal recognition particle protein [Bacillota bacterium]
MSSLSDRLQDIFARLKGKGKLSEADVNTAMREVRVALLEADVNYKIAKDFCARVKDRAVGEEVMKSLTPGQQVVKIVNDELVELMGGASDQKSAKLLISPKPPTVILMAGLQGSGKTTSAGKIALYLKNQGKRPLLAAGDVYRPAAIQQLQVLGKRINVPVFTLGDKASPVQIAEDALAHARQHGNDYLIVDTAGRLAIDEEMMNEIAAIREAVDPTEILLVIDAMQGQDAVNVAAAFHERLHVTGIVLTKMDGDSRGGAALPVKAVTGQPIKFTGSGEDVKALEPFYPERMASRILGMGDVLTLIEKAQESMDAETMVRMEEKLRKNAFTLDDFLEQSKQVRKMGDMKEMLSMIPGMGKQIKNMEIDEKQFVVAESIIHSMTPAERSNPAIINSSRRKRIAAGCGRQVQDVNRLLKQFEQMQQLMKRINNMNSGKGGKKGKKGRRGFPNMGNMGGMGFPGF